MRCAIMLASILTLGGLAVNDVDGQVKEDPKPKAKADEKFDETVILLMWLPREKKFTGKGVEWDAYRLATKKGDQLFVLKQKKVSSDRPWVKSEITDKDGTVWTVTKLEGGGDDGYTCTVTKKPVEKKPE